MNVLEYWGYIFVLLWLWLSNMGGIGGGGVVVPISMIFFQHDAKNAIALSNFSIFLSSLIRYIANARKPHPLKKGRGVLVDQNLAILMLPLIISGSTFGVILYIWLPDIVIIASYVLGLLYLGSGVLKKTIRLYKKEV